MQIYENNDYADLKSLQIFDGDDARASAASSAFDDRLNCIIAMIVILSLDMSLLKCLLCVLRVYALEGTRAPTSERRTPLATNHNKHAANCNLVNELIC